MVVGDEDAVLAVAEQALADDQVARFEADAGAVGVGRRGCSGRRCPRPAPSGRRAPERALPSQATPSKIDRAGLARDIGDAAAILHRALPIGAGRDQDRAAAAADRRDRLGELSKPSPLSSTVNGAAGGLRRQAAWRRRRGRRSPESDEEFAVHARGLTGEAAAVEGGTGLTRALARIRDGGAAKLAPAFGATGWTKRLDRLMLFQMAREDDGGLVHWCNGLLALGGGRSTAPGPAPRATSSGTAIAADDGDALGYASRADRAERRTGARSSTSSEMRAAGAGRSGPARIVERTVTRQDPMRAGRSRSATYSQIGLAWSRIEARIGGGARRDRAPDAARNGGRYARRRCRAGVRFDGGEGLLPGWDMAATPRLEFENFNLDAMVVERVVIEAVPGAAPDAEGGSSCSASAMTGASCGRWRGCCSTASAASSPSPSRCSAPASPPGDRPGDGAAGRIRPISSCATRWCRAPFRMSATARAGPYPLPLRLSRRARFRAAANRRAAGDGAAGRRWWSTFAQTCGPGLPSDAASLADALPADRLAAERSSAAARHRAAGGAHVASPRRARWSC